MKLVLVKVKQLPPGYTGPILLPMDNDLSGIPDGEIIAEIKQNKQRTLTQNRAIHKYCAMLSGDLNDAGLDMRRVIKDEIDIPWTEVNAKEFLWRPIQKALGLPDSTTELTTKDVDVVYQTLSRHLSAKHNITTSFPSRHGD